MECHPWKSKGRKEKGIIVVTLELKGKEVRLQSINTYIRAPVHALY